MKTAEFVDLRVKQIETTLRVVENIRFLGLHHDLLSRVHRVSETDSRDSSPFRFAIIRRVVGHFSICFQRMISQGNETLARPLQTLVGGAVSSSLVTTRLNASRSIPFSSRSPSFLVGLQASEF